MNTTPYFPVPIYNYQTPFLERKDFQDEMENMYNSLEFEHVPNWEHDTHELNKSPFSGDVVEGMPRFGKYLNRHLHHYLDEFGAPNFKEGSTSNREYLVTQAWFTRTSKDQYAHMHAHGSNDISGVYYFQTNNRDGNLWFQSPHMSQASNFVFGQLLAELEVQPKVGKLLLWPASLQHGVTRNQTDHERVSLSFNIQFRRAGFIKDDQYHNETNSEVFKDTLTISRREVESSGKVAAVPPRPFPGKRI